MSLILLQPIFKISDLTTNALTGLYNLMKALLYIKRYTSTDVWFAKLK